MNSYSVDKATAASTDLNFISQLTGLFNNNSVLTMSFAITLFSFAGVPPLLGFYGKMQVLYTAISVGFIFVSIIAINMSVISAYYYLKLIQVSNFINANMYSKTDLENNVNKEKSILNNSLSKFMSNSYFTGKGYQQGVGDVITATPGNNINIINNLHSYLISIITLIILLFTIKTDLLFNLTNILTSYSYNI
jgi:NADH-ubiquinone oxidoreductase chain 2